MKLRDLNRNALIWSISVLLKFFWECCSTLAPGSLHNSGRRWGINQTWATNTCSSFSVINRSFSCHIRKGQIPWIFLCLLLPLLLFGQRSIFLIHNIICHFRLLSSEAQYLLGKFSFFSPPNFRREFWWAYNCSVMVLGITFTYLFVPMRFQFFLANPTYWSGNGGASSGLVILLPRNKTGATSSIAIS